MSKSNSVGNFVISAITALWGPVLGGILLVSEYDLPAWKALAAILICIAVLNFLGILSLEPTKQDRPYTLISFMFMILILLSMMLVEVLEEQVNWFRAEWLHPIVTTYLVFITIAIFRERYPLLKFYLALNGLVLALSWGGLLERKVSFVHF